MKKYFAIFYLLSSIFLVADAATLQVNSRNFTSEPTQRRRVTLTLIEAGPVVAGPWLVAGDSVAKFTDTNGVAYYSNVLAGAYRLDVAGSPGRSYPITVMDTNVLLNAADLVNSTNLNTSFYTAAQVDALLVNAGGGGSLDTDTVTAIADAAARAQMQAGSNPVVATSVTAGSANISGITAVTINASGGISATGGFTGPGAGLTQIPAGQLTGTISQDRFPATINANISGNAATATTATTATTASALTPGAFIPPASGEWLTNITHRVFDVIDFGADPSGVTACGSNIQAAIDAACVAGGGVVFFPPGNYSVGTHMARTNFYSEAHPSSLVVWSNNVWLKGSGAYSTKIQPGVANMSGGLQRNFLGVAESNFVAGAWVRMSTTNFYMSDLTLDLQGLGLDEGFYDTTQIYRVFGDGVYLKDCIFENNKNNDGIDVQFGTDLRLDNCISRNNGGDAMGVQDTITWINGGIYENCGQEAFELNEVDVKMFGVIGRSCSNLMTLNAYTFSAVGCTFTGTNPASHTFHVANSFSVRSVSFESCVFAEDNGSATYATFYVQPNDSLRIENCSVRGAKLFMFANDSDSVRVVNTSFGSPVWTDFSGGGIILNSVNDAQISLNNFYGAGFAVLATNGNSRLNVNNNTFRSAAAFSGTTNTVISGNVFANSAQLLLTNANNCVVSGNANGSLVAINCISNTFTGNSWLTAPLTSGNDTYWGSRVADSITNKFIVIGERADFTGFYGNHYGAFIGGASSLTNLPLVDHFMGGFNGGLVGDHGWNVYGSSPTHRAKFAAGRQSCWHFVTAATQGATAGAGGYYDSQAGSGVFDVDATGWRLKMVFKFDETTDVFHRLGFMNAASVTTTTNEYAGVYLRFRSSTDSFFTFVARSAGAGPETTANSTVAADTGWHTLTIRSAAAGMYFSIDGETEQLVASNIPTVGQLAWLAGTQTATAKTIWMDYLEYSPQ